MDVVWVLLGAGAIGAGVALAINGMRAPVLDAAAILAELDGIHGPVDTYEERLDEPLIPRLLRPVGEHATRLFQGLLPGARLERLQARLVRAGLDARLGPEEFVAMQLVALVAGGSLAAGLSILAGWGPAGLTRSVVIGSVVGALMPMRWLQRRRDARMVAVRRDMPDVLDLMAISVEAGVGLEGAIEVVTSHFDTPVARELGRLLREMELGLSRRAALQNLKARLAVPEVSNFVLSLVQADALGMPLGRVLRAQAHELRLRRRQWARERAARLPVKIVFPLMVFILPALFVVVLGPAVMSIGENIL